MTDISLHPKYEAILQEVNLLKEDISDLLFEYDKLVLQTCKVIETDYIMKVGMLEYKIFELQCNIQRLKRKIEIIQTAINRQEVYFVSEIDTQLENEFSNYIKEIEKKTKAINNALYRYENTTPMSKDEALELKKIYTEIIKKLHPDLNPNLGENKTALFYHAVEAYKNGDLLVLKNIQILITDDKPTTNEDFNLTALENKRDKMLSHKSELEQKIATIKSVFPYNQKDFLTDEKKVNERVNELNKHIEDNNATLKELETRLSTMVRIK